HVLDALPYYAANPEKIIMINEGGMAIFGGLVGGMLGGIGYAKLHNLPVGKLADAAAPAMALGQAIGRIGCFFNGDHQGIAANLPWATQYTKPHTLVPDFAIPRHPTQVYEFIYDFALFGLLWFLRKRISVD